MKINKVIIIDTKVSKSKVYLTIIIVNRNCLVERFKMNLGLLQNILVTMFFKITKKISVLSVKKFIKSQSRNKKETPSVLYHFPKKRQTSLIKIKNKKK